MDQIIRTTWWDRNKKRTYIMSSLGVFIVAILWMALKPAPQNIDVSKLRLSTVDFGEFQEIVVANGFIEPKSTILVDAKEGGTIKEILVEEGQLVNAGDVMLILTNEALMLDYMQRETQIVEQINNLRNTRIILEQNLRSSEDQLDNVVVELELASKQFQIDSTLYQSSGISRQRYEETETNYLFLIDRVNIFTKRQKDDKIYHKDQVKRIDSSIDLMERNLELIREKLNEMNVKAPISGQLNSFDLEPGQVLQRNQTIGRIDQPDNFWIRAVVDQHYLNRISIGQQARINYAGNDYKLLVNKVQSSVENGQFEVFLNFEDEAPEDLRRGQNLQVYIEVSAVKQSLKLERGSFFQSSGGQFVFVYDKETGIAKKQKVSLGRQNPSFYEVIEGLEKGQEVIISSYNGFEDETELIITDIKQ